MAQGSRVRRARRLVTFSAFAPPLLVDIHFVWWEVAGDGLGSDELLMVGGVTLLLWLLGLWPFLATRRTPNSWTSVALPGGLLTLLMFSQLGIDSRGSMGTLTAIATMITVAAVSFLLPYHARKTVLTDLSPDVVDSDLTITFKPRRGSSAILVVAPEGVGVAEDSQSPDRFHVEVPFDELTAVTTWTEVENTEWTLPGDEERTMSMPAGDLLGFDTPDGQLVVAVHDTAGAKRFVEARAALARRQTAPVDE
jgi:hypothetical protein